jgi:hypothetical protein
LELEKLKETIKNKDARIEVLTAVLTLLTSSKDLLTEYEMQNLRRWLDS